MVKAWVCWFCGFEYRWGHGWLSFSCEWYTLSGRGFYHGPITRPGESYRVWCVCLNMISKPQLWEGHGPLGRWSHEKNSHVRLPRPPNVQVTLLPVATPSRDRIIIIIIIITAIDFHSVAVVRTRINVHKNTIQRHITNNTEHNKYKHTYYENTHTIFKTPSHYKTRTYTYPYITKQVKTTTVQDIHEIK
jgi:hypothetical protein